ncbi:hypothetical protein [Streptomyces sp. KR80]|uniref:hypothetical protein n=1 Tax=Streptomyces sp. KR80 TaxID=3457426 RepID=UPI003FD12354
MSPTRVIPAPRPVEHGLATGGPQVIKGTVLEPHPAPWAPYRRRTAGAIVLIAVGTAAALAMLLPSQPPGAGGAARDAVASPDATPAPGADVTPVPGKDVTPVPGAETPVPGADRPAAASAPPGSGAGPGGLPDGGRTSAPPRERTKHAAEPSAPAPGLRTAPARSRPSPRGPVAHRPTARTQGRTNSRHHGWHHRHGQHDGGRHAEDREDGDRRSGQDGDHGRGDQHGEGHPREHGKRSADRHEG